MPAGAVPLPKQSPASPSSWPQASRFSEAAEPAAAGEEAGPGLHQSVEEQQHPTEEDCILLEGVLLQAGRQAEGAAAAAEATRAAGGAPKEAAGGQAVLVCHICSRSRSTKQGCLGACTAVPNGLPAEGNCLHPYHTPKMYRRRAVSSTHHTHRPPTCWKNFKGSFEFGCWKLSSSSRLRVSSMLFAASPASELPRLAAHSARAAVQATAAGGEQRDRSHRSLCRSMRPVSRFMLMSVVPAQGGGGAHRAAQAAQGRQIGSGAEQDALCCVGEQRGFGCAAALAALHCLPSQCNTRGSTIDAPRQPQRQSICHRPLHCTCHVDGQGAQAACQPPRDLRCAVAQHAHAGDADCWLPHAAGHKVVALEASRSLELAKGVLQTGRSRGRCGPRQGASRDVKPGSQGQPPMHVCLPASMHIHAMPAMY